jgi:hypothetical protein
MSSDALIVRCSSSAPRPARGNSKDDLHNPHAAAAIRKISRLIKLIPNTDEAVSILVTCIQGKLIINDTKGYGSESFLTYFEAELNQLRTKKLNRFCSGWIRNVEDHFVDVIHDALAKYHEAITTRKSIVPTASAEASMSLEISDVTMSPSFRTTEPLSVLENIAIISDDSEGIIEEEEAVALQKASAFVKLSTDSVIDRNQFWFLLLEHLHLCITSNMIRGKGIRPKKYDIYRLVRSTRALSSRFSSEETRLKIVKELLWIVNGTSRDSDKTSLQQYTSYCRVYATLQKQSTLWLQVNLGPVARSKQMKVKEFTLVVSSESPFVAVATNQMSEKNRFISYVLSAVETVLADNNVVYDLAQTRGKIKALPRYLSCTTVFAKLLTYYGAV